MQLGILPETEQTMKKRPCHLCGSTNWPSPTTTCPLCVGDADPELDYDEDWGGYFPDVGKMVSEPDCADTIKHD